MSKATTTTTINSKEPTLVEQVECFKEQIKFHQYKARAYKEILLKRILDNVLCLQDAETIKIYIRFALNTLNAIDNPLHEGDKCSPQS